jgi:outer membrane protein
LDLSRSVSMAVERATAVLLADEAVAVSGAALLESYGRFLPDVHVGASAFSENGTLLLSSTALRASSAALYGGAYGISTSVNLFNGLRDREHLRAALIERDAARATLEHARAQVAFDVAQAYFQVILDQRLDSVARSSLQLSATRERLLREQVAAGLRAPPDLLRQEAQTQFNQAAVIDAANRVRADEIVLLRRLRESPSRPHAIRESVVDTAPLPAGALSPSSVLTQAIARRADLAAAQDRVRSDQHTINVAKGGRLPRLSLGVDWIGAGRVFQREVTGGIDQLTSPQTPLGTQLGRQGYAIASLGVSWDVFDRWRSRLEIDRASAAAARDQLIADDLRLQIEGEVQRALDDYAAARDRLSATTAALRAASEAFAAVQARYDLGLATFVDVLSAQNALTQATALREQATISIALQKAVLRYVSGEPR